jgi:N-acetylglucosaminyldiphosphoundecaprenol N-acetyl-beta-D-mannosaminyltransferase
MIPSTNILGIQVSAINMDMTLEIIQSWIQKRERHYVCVAAVQSIMECQRDETLRHIFNDAGLVTPDGMPLVWLSRLNGHTHVRRVYGPDLMLALFSQSTLKGYRHFLYGGAPGVPERLSQSLHKKFSGVRIVGCHSPPFRTLSVDEDANIVQMINKSEADIIWVGLGTSKQEHWIAEHMDRLNAIILIGVGAAFDFHAGVKKQAPLWIQRSGLEWLFRLATEPGRLWRRYLINNPLFILLILSQILGIKRYRIE